MTLSPITNNNNNLKLGMGILLVTDEPVMVTDLADLDLTTFVNLGNCKSIKYNTSVDTVEHKNMQSPVARPDRKTIRGRTETLTMTCDNMSERIYNAFVLGQANSLVTHLGATGRYETITNFNPYSAFILGDSGTMKTGAGLVGNVIIGVDKAAVDADAPANGQPDTRQIYKEGRDYRLRKVEQEDGTLVANGTIEILANGYMARGLLPDGSESPAAPASNGVAAKQKGVLTNLVVKYDILPSTQTVIASSTNQKTWQLYFIADNADGDNDSFYIAKGQVSPSGDLDWISDDYMSADFTIDILVPDIQEIEAFSIIKPAKLV